MRRGVRRLKFSSDQAIGSGPTPPALACFFCDFQARVILDPPLLKGQ